MKTVIEMAREAGLTECQFFYEAETEQLERFAALVREDTLESPEVVYWHNEFVKANSTVSDAPSVSELIEAIEEVLRISDRKHNAWDKAREVIAKFKEKQL